MPLKTQRAQLIKQESCGKCKCQISHDYSGNGFIAAKDTKCTINKTRVMWKCSAKNLMTIADNGFIAAKNTKSTINKTRVMRKM